jgi:nucleoside-diphosphate-sugar epimerase
MTTTSSTEQPTGAAAELHVVVGKGPVGSTTADLLAAAGHRVRVLSRSGGTGSTAIGHPAVEHVAVDAADAAAVLAATDGATVVYNCLNPEYHRWATDWPPMATGLLDAAEAHGAVLVTMSNLYGYGPVDRPMTEDLPLAAPGTKGRVRAEMWDQALQRHRDGRVRITEARASDFWGPGVTDGGYLGERAVPRILAGKKVQTIGSPDHLHSFSYIPDVARTLVVLGTDERAWGRAWHVPTAPARTLRQMVTALSAAAGVDDVGCASIPWPFVVAGGAVVPFFRELRETRYQFDRPFVLDSGAATATFGLQPTSVEDAAAATVAWWRDRLAVATAA